MLNGLVLLARLSHQRRVNGQRSILSVAAAKQKGQYNVVTARGRGLNLQHDVHLVERLALGLGQEEVGPDRRDHHPAREEVPRSEAEGLEDVRERLGQDELDEP